MSQLPARFPWEPKPLPAAKDYLAEIGKMRATSLAMADAVDRCVKVLQQELISGKPRPEMTGSDDAANGIKHDPEDALPTPSGETMMALTALSHVRDVLSGRARTFDASVLSPLNHALDNGRFPSPPAPPTTESSRADDATVGSAASRLDTAPSVSSHSSGITTPPLILSTRRGDKPLPGLTRTPYRHPDIVPEASAHKSLPRPPRPQIPSESTSSAAPATDPLSRSRPVTESRRVLDPLGVSP